MNKIQQDHDIHGMSDHNNIDRMQHPYWKRAHRDWRFWIMLSLMLVAVLFYVMSDNFALLYRSR